MRRRITLLLASLAALAVVTTSALGAHHSTTVRTATNSKLGTFLVNHGKRTLYHLTGETTHHFLCTRAMGCTTLWPPQIVASKSAIANDSVKGLSTVRRPDTHKLQVTFKGKPLYTFAGDHKPGDTNGQGFLGVWFVLVTKQPASTQTMTTTPPPSTGGYGY